jgi:hypothetical protein
MRKLSYDYKLPGRSLAEVYERFHGSLNRHRAVGRVKFSGRKLSAEAMVNAVILSFLDLDEGEQEAILSTYVPQFEKMLAEDPPLRHDRGSEGEETHRDIPVEREVIDPRSDTARQRGGEAG